MLVSLLNLDKHIRINIYNFFFSHWRLKREQKGCRQKSACAYHDSKALIGYVKDNYGVEYSNTGIVDLLHRLGFTYKKPKVIPGKADAEKQVEYLENKLRPLLDKHNSALWA